MINYNLNLCNNNVSEPKSDYRINVNQLHISYGERNTCGRRRMDARYVVNKISIEACLFDFILRKTFCQLINDCINHLKVRKFFCAHNGSESVHFAVQIPLNRQRKDEHTKPPQSMQQAPIRGGSLFL